MQLEMPAKGNTHNCLIGGRRCVRLGTSRGTKGWPSWDGLAAWGGWCFSILQRLCGGTAWDFDIARTQTRRVYKLGGPWEANISIYKDLAVLSSKLGLSNAF